MMYCPTCGGEYRDGFVECAECGTELTEEPPAPEASHPDAELVTVLESGDPAELAFVESLLQTAAIPYFMRGDALQDLFGLGRLGAGFNPIVGPVAVLVPAERESEALALIQRGSVGEPLGEDEAVEPE
jgi:hypothetical protein